MINLQFFKTALKSIIRIENTAWKFGQYNSSGNNDIVSFTSEQRRGVGEWWVLEENYSLSEIIENQTAVNIFIMFRSVMFQFRQVSLL